MGDTVNDSNTDNRIRTYLPPARILLAEGRIENAERLLRTRADQVGLHEREMTVVRGKGRILFDFGRELHGGIRLVAGAGTDGAGVRAVLGESAAEALSRPGEKNSGNAHALRDLSFPLPFYSDTEMFQSGFRFLLLEFTDPGAEYAVKAVNAVSVGIARERKGSFSCPDKRITEIYETAAYTTELCAQKYFWDGIKRDRLVWMGDLYPEIVSFLSLYDDDGTVERSLDFVKDQTPLPGWMNGYPMYSMWWIIILEEYLRLTGNRAYVSAQRPYFEGLLTQIDGCVREDGDFDFGMHFIDWPTYGHPDEKEGVRALGRLCANAACRLETFYGIRTGMAEKIGAKFAAAGAPVREKKQILALKHLSGAGLSEEENALLGAGGARGFSTFMSYFILSALAETHGMDAALAAMKEYYGGMLDMGATAFWEDFNVAWTEGDVCPLDRIPAPGQKEIHGDFGQFCYTGYRHSLCHGWSAGVVYFLVTKVLGISSAEDGFQKIRIRPDLGSLEEAEAAVPTPRGLLKVSCRRENGVQVLRVSGAGGAEILVENAVLLSRTGENGTK